jgi:hypothetical protein
MMSKLFKYNSKLVGVTFEGRQAVISTLTGKEQLRVRREADNEYDPNAVAVDVQKDKEWLPIGYIAKDKNLEIAKSLDANIPVEIVLSTITGGDGKSFGVNIELQYKEAPKTTAKKVEVKEEEQEVVRPTKEQMQQVLAYLTQVVDKSGKKTVEPTTYNSVLLGKNIEVQEVNGHKRLEGFLSGSKFPEQFYQEFDSTEILKAIKEKHGLTDKEVEQLQAMWDINSQASTNLGNSIHLAMENYDRNFGLGDKTKKVKKFKTKPDEVGANKALSRNPVLKKVVESFHELFGGDYIRFNEEFIWDKGLKLCGSVDRIKVVDLKKRVIRIQDFKTDADINEAKYQLTTSPFYSLTQGDNPTMGKALLDYHWLQLSFYAFILQRAGWTVEGLDVYWMNGEKLVSGENPWEEFSHDVIDISEVILGVE